MDFFQTDEIKNKIEVALSKRAIFENSANPENKVATILISFLEITLLEPELWDRSCGFRISKGGDGIGRKINVFSKINGPEDTKRFLSDIKDLFLHGFMLLEEFLLFHGDDPVHKLIQPTRHIYDNFDSLIHDINTKGLFNEDDKNRYDYAKNRMVVDIIRWLLASGRFSKLLELDEQFDSQLKIANTTVDILSETTTKAEELKNHLTHYTSRFDFVGMHSAFENMWKEKKTERIVRGIILTLLALLITVIMGATGYRCYEFVFTESNSISIKHIPALFIVLPSIIFFLYLFKIYLGFFQSTIAQMVQLKLRSNLCVFLPDYFKFLQDTNSINDKNSIKATDLFEQLIFSNIIVDQNKIPDAMDGVDKIAHLIKSLKS